MHRPSLKVQKRLGPTWGLYHLDCSIVTVDINVGVVIDSINDAELDGNLPYMLPVYAGTKHSMARPSTEMASVSTVLLAKESVHAYWPPASKMPTTESVLSAQ